MDQAGIEAVKAAGRSLSDELHRALREGDGSPPEADAGVNGASVAVVRAMADNAGEAWLVDLNPGPSGRHYWRWNGDGPDAFGASAVLSTFDEDLAVAIVARLAGPYTGTKDDRGRVEAIFARIDALGGERLVWT